MNSSLAILPPSDDGRHQPRTHLFVAATLYSEGSQTPVHIRNMSPTGALVEAATLPEVGCRIGLTRGSLQATGHVAWRVEGRAGVRFDSPLCVADWMARLVSSGQERVDQLVTALKNKEPSAHAMGSPPLSVDGELMQLRTDLALLGSSLIADVIVAATHPEIQTIDICVQRIDRLLDRIRAT